MKKWLLLIFGFGGITAGYFLLTHNTYNPVKSLQLDSGPPRIGIQAGHYKISELPDEFSDNAARSTGTSAGGFTEQQVNLAIAERTAAILRSQGMVVDVLPATIPIDYQADAFISIHADGSQDSSARGFKITGARYDRTGKAADLSSAIKNSYGAATSLPQDDNITRNMYNYYAFNTWRYDHSIARSTPGVILETGFLTNSEDRRVITESLEVVTSGIAGGITAFINASR